MTWTYPFLTFPHKAAWDAARASFATDDGYAYPQGVEVYYEANRQWREPNPDYVEGGEEPEQLVTLLDTYVVNVALNGVELPEGWGEYALEAAPKNPQAAPAGVELGQE